MWSKLLALLPLVLKIVGVILDKNNANKQIKKQYLDLINSIDEHMLSGVKVRKSDQDQVDDLNKKHSEVNK